MKKRIIVLCLLFLIINICNAEKIKIYVFYTPSHEELFFEWFLPTLQDDFDIVVERYAQECLSGKFMREGWIDTMLRKVDLIIRAIYENWGKIFIHSDVDVQFFKGFQKEILSLMKDYDMIIQKDNPSGQVCAGFFISRGNEKTLNLWKTIRKSMIRNPSRHDQNVLNDIIRGSNSIGISWDYLPITFFSGGTLTGKYWQPGKKIKIPKNIILHHANWTQGVKNKIAQLKFVRNLVNYNEEQREIVRYGF